MNILINKLSKLEFVDEIVIPPSPGDSGAAQEQSIWIFKKWK